MQDSELKIRLEGKTFSLFASLFIVLFISGCLASPSHETSHPSELKKYSDEEKKDAVLTLIKCTRIHEKRLDDYVSDAMSIAIAVSDACLKENEALTMIYASSAPSQMAYDMLIKAFRLDYPKDALPIVLEWRRKHKQSISVK